MTSTLVLIKISLIAKNLFDKKTGEELENIKLHFSEAFSDAQLCALVVVGMVLRVFGLAPEEQKGSRGMMTVLGLLVQFIRTLKDQPDMFPRAVPTPLDIMVEDGLTEIDHITIED